MKTNKKQNIFKDKITGKECTVKDVSVESGPLKVIIIFDDKETAERKINELEFIGTINEL